MIHKYVLFYCDDCDLLKPAIETFVAVHALITVHTTSSIDDLVAKVNEHMPAMIFVYLHDEKKNYMNLIKTIRDNVATSSIPVLMYKTLPDAEELKAAFNQITSLK